MLRDHGSVPWTPESRTPLELALAVGVAPERWVGHHRLHRPLRELAWRRCKDLWHERDPSPWLRSGGGDPRRAWALWTALHALGADFTEPRREPSWVHAVVGRPRHALASINGSPVGFRRLDTRDHLLRLGRRGAHVVVPGATLEEEVEQTLGLSLDLWRGASRPTAWDGSAEGGGSPAGDGEDGDTDGSADDGDVGVDGGASALGDLVDADWSALVDLEHERAVRWLEADWTLGLVCLLGALPEHLHPSGARRRAAGYLDHVSALTPAGWWRLCHLAGQGRGWTERGRARLLRSCRDRVVDVGGQLVRRPGAPRFAPKHLTLVQRRVLEYMDTGHVPLGVEYSLLGAVTRRLVGRRSDALLIAPDGHIVWLEVMRRPLTRGSRPLALAWQELAQAIGMLSARTRRRVELVVYEPRGVCTRREYEHRRVAPDSATFA